MTEKEENGGGNGVVPLLASQPKFLLEPHRPNAGKRWSRSGKSRLSSGGGGTACVTGIGGFVSLGDSFHWGAKVHSFNGCIGVIVSNCRLVVNWVGTMLTKEVPDRAEQVTARLVAEYQELRRRFGVVRLPDPSTLESVEDFFRHARTEVGR